METWQVDIVMNVRWW